MVCFRASDSTLRQVADTIPFGSKRYTKATSEAQGGSETLIPGLAWLAYRAAYTIRTRSEKSIS